MENPDNSRMIDSIDSIHKRNSIRIGLVGCVSSGKSTLLNAICVNEYEDMKIKRTTMLPKLYMETNQDIYDNDIERNKIYKENKEINKKIYNGDIELNEANCKVIEYIIPQISDFIDLPDNIYIGPKLDLKELL